jgi:hypothetical protein
MIRLPKISAKRIISAVVITFLGFWVAATVLVPLVIGDNLGAYKGAAREVSQKLLAMQHHEIDSSPTPDFTLQLHIDNVRAVSAQEKSKYCSDPDYISNDPNNYHYYAVTISERMLLEWGSEQRTYIGCEPHGVQLEEFGLTGKEIPGSDPKAGFIISH